MFVRLLTLLALAATVLVPAAQSAPLAAPSGLHAFLLRVDEPLTDTFPRTPAFAWTPYDSARSYDFELATSRSFGENTIVWSTTSRATPLQAPAVSVPLALPWMTGKPYALYAHVRAHSASGLSRWSAPFGFNTRLQGLPQSITPDLPGLVRWRPIEGATSYEVWFVDAGKIISTTTNVADEREYYSFHRDPTWTATVQWRVRAVRTLYGSLPSGLPAVSYGPWSETFLALNPPVTDSPLEQTETVSDVVGTPAAPAAHRLTPGFVYSGDIATGGTGRLFRVYVATDRECVNVVFKGAVVGSPAYAPRASGPLTLPTSTSAVTAAEGAYLADGPQAGTFAADLSAVTTNEQSATASTASGGATTGATAPAGFSATGMPVDLWDSGWPTGRYYWTVVPVQEVTTATALTYRDAEVPQDACAAGRVNAFGKASQPAMTSASEPYASGLTPTGELAAARTATPSFYGAALIAWQPALGAAGYEVQWTKTRYPWKTASTTPVYTAATSMLLEGLTPGTWYYRVRGIDPYVVGPLKQMTWSQPVGIKLAKPRFIDQSGVTIRPVTK
jgi:hypothetical protein